MSRLTLACLFQGDGCPRVRAYAALAPYPASVAADRPSRPCCYARLATTPGYVIGTKSLAHAGMVVGRAGFARIRVRGIAWSLGRPAGATGHRAAPAESRIRAGAAGGR